MGRRIKLLYSGAWRGNVKLFDNIEFDKKKGGTKRVISLFV